MPQNKPKRVADPMQAYRDSLTLHNRGEDLVSMIKNPRTTSTQWEQKIDSPNEEGLNAMIRLSDLNGQRPVPISQVKRTFTDGNTGYANRYKKPTLPTSFPRPIDYQKPIPTTQVTLRGDMELAPRYAGPIITNKPNMLQKEIPMKRPIPRKTRPEFIPYDAAGYPTIGGGRVPAGYLNKPSNREEREVGTVPTFQEGGPIRGMVKYTDGNIPYVETGGYGEPETWSKPNAFERLHSGTMETLQQTPVFPLTLFSNIRRTVENNLKTGTPLSSEEAWDKVNEMKAIHGVNPRRNGGELPQAKFGNFLQGLGAAASFASPFMNFIPGVGPMVSPLMGVAGEALQQIPMEHGGLIKYKGPSHEQGGIPVNAMGIPSPRPVAEVEGGETAYKLKGEKSPYVFSVALKDKASGKTFAALSDAISKRYEKRNDEVAKNSMEREMSRLMASNEAARKAKEYRSYMRKFGGRLPQAKDGKFLGLEPYGWGQMGMTNLGNVPAYIDSLKKEQKMRPLKNPYEQQIAAGPNYIDPSSNLAANRDTYLNQSANIPTSVNGSGQSYLTGKASAAAQKYRADADVYNQVGNANAQIGQQYRNQLLALGQQNINTDAWKQEADQRARNARKQQMFEAGNAIGMNAQNAYNQQAWFDLMRNQYGLRQNGANTNQSSTPQSSSMQMMVPQNLGYYPPVERPAYTGPQVNAGNYSDPMMNASSDQGYGPVRPDLFEAYFPFEKRRFGGKIKTRYGRS